MYYFLVDKYFGKREVHIPPGINMWVSNICESCGGNNVTYPEPIQFEIKGKPCDYYIGCGQIFISQYCLDVFCELNLTGYYVKPAKIIGWNKAKNKLDFANFIYYELIITGRCGFMLNMQSEFLPKCDVCGRNLPLKESICGLRFDSKYYDGSDMFSFDNLSHIPIVGEDVKRKLIKAKLTNLKFTELSKMEVI